MRYYFERVNVEKHLPFITPWNKVYEIPTCHEVDHCQLLFFARDNNRMRVVMQRHAVEWRIATIHFLQNQGVVRFAMKFGKIYLLECGRNPYNIYLQKNSRGPEWANVNQS